MTKKTHVLLGVHDEELIKFLKKPMKSMGLYPLIPVTEGKKLFEEAARLVPDLLIIDLHLLPREQVSELIREWEREYSLPTLLLYEPKVHSGFIPELHSPLTDLQILPCSAGDLRQRIETLLDLGQKIKRIESISGKSESQPGPFPSGIGAEQLHTLFIDQGEQGFLLLENQSVIFANPSARFLCGIDCAKNLPFPPAEFFQSLPRDERRELEENISRITGESGPRIMALPYKNLAGNRGWMELTMTPVLHDGNCLIRMVLSDITEKKRLSEKLTASERRFHSLSESSPLILFELNLEGEFVLIPPLLKPLVRPKLHLFSDLLERKERKALKTIFSEVLAGNVSEPQEMKLTFGKGDPKYLEITFLPVTGKDSPVSILGIARDISERKLRDATLDEYQAKWQSLVENAPERICLVDREGMIRFCNRTLFSDLLDEEQETSLFDYVNPAGAKEIHDALHFVFEKKKNSRFEVCLTPPRGTMHYLEISITPVIRNDEVVAGMCISADITERRRTEEALRLSERLNRATIDALSDPIFLVDQEFNITLYNRAFAKWCDNLRLETTAVGKNIFNIFPFFTRKTREEYKRVLKSGEKTVTEEKVTLAGRTYFTENIKIPIVEGKKIEQVLTIIHDITDFRTTQLHLQETMQRYELAVEASGQIAYEYDSEKGVIIWGKSLEKILGYPASEVDGTFRQWVDWIHPEDRRTALGHLADPSGAESFRFAEFRLRRRDSQYLWMRNRGFYLVKGTPPAIYFLGMLEDISRQKQAEGDLRKSEEAYRQLFQQNIHGNIIIIGDRIAMANEAFCSLTGLTVEELLGKSVLELIHPDDRETAVERLGRLMRGEIEQSMMVYRAKRWDGVYALAEIRSKRIEWHGKPALQTLVRDITEQRKAEEALRESEERYRSLVERVIDGVYRSTYDGRFIEVNPALVKILGYETKQELLNVNIPDALYFDPAERIRISREQSQEDESKIIEVQLKRKDGTPIWVEDHGHYVRDESGNIILHEGIIRDISIRKRAEEAIREQLIFNQTLIDTIPNPVYYKDKDGYFLGCNRAFEEFFQVSRQDIIGKTLGGFTSPNIVDTDRIRDKELLTLPGKQVFEGSLVDNRGDPRQVIFNKAAFSDAEGNIAGTIGIISDISDRAKMEERIRQERDRAQTYLDIANVGFLALNTEGCVILVNKKICETLGIQEHDIIGKNWFDHFLPEKERDEVKTVFRKMIDGERDPFEYHENSVLTRPGEERLIAWHNTVVRDEEGKIVATLSSGEDITERRKNEERIEASLKEKEILLREIHHRVKNNLQVISSLLKLQATLIKDPTVNRLFQESRDRIRSISMVHEKLYRSADLTRIDFADYVKTLVNEIIRNYRENASQLTQDIRIGKMEIEVDIAIPCGLIINELVSNAMKYAFPRDKEIRRKNKISIQMDFREKDRKYCLTVSDNGIGLPENLDIKKTESLGLHLVRILMTEQLSGTIVISRDKGTKIMMEFPREAQ